MIVIRRVGAEDVIDLRHAVLRAGLPRDTAVFAGDDGTQARHYGAFEDGRIIGCVTLHPSKWEDVPAWQLRGMAVAPDARARGLGRAMIEFLENDIAGSGVTRMWCNARVPASGFYQRHGWKIVSEQFDIPTAGPHVRMTRRIAVK